jgi:hypothetical protein
MRASPLPKLMNLDGKDLHTAGPGGFSPRKGLGGCYQSISPPKQRLEPWVDLTRQCGLGLCCYAEPEGKSSQSLDFIMDLHACISAALEHGTAKLKKSTSILSQTASRSEKNTSCDGWRRQRPSLRVRSINLPLLRTLLLPRQAINIRRETRRKQTLASAESCKGRRGSFSSREHHALAVPAQRARA